MELMRRLLGGMQSHLRIALQDNRALAARIDSDLHLANKQVATLRGELYEIRRQMNSFAQIPPAEEVSNHADNSKSPNVKTKLKDDSKYDSSSASTERNSAATKNGSGLSQTNVSSKASDSKHDYPVELIRTASPCKYGTSVSSPALVNISPESKCGSSGNSPSGCKNGVTKQSDPSFGACSVSAEFVRSLSPDSKNGTSVSSPERPIVSPKRSGLRQGSLVETVGKHSTDKVEGSPCHKSVQGVIRTNGLQSSSKDDFTCGVNETCDGQAEQKVPSDYKAEHSLSLSNNKRSIADEPQIDFFGQNAYQEDKQVDIKDTEGDSPGNKQLLQQPNPKSIEKNSKDSLTESSEASSDVSACRQQHRRDLRIDESDNNQNSAPECDLSSPFRDIETEPLLPKGTEQENCPPVKGESYYRLNHRSSRGNSDPLEKRHLAENSADFAVLSSPSSSAMMHKSAVYDSKDARRPYREWRTSLSCQPKTEDSRKGEKVLLNFVDESSYVRMSSNVDYASLYSACGDDIEALRIQNSALLRDLAEVMESRDEKAKENALLASRFENADRELKHAREALAALKADRKRLKSEKFDLLTQMKQLYSTLEDKEAELRQFIRNYEQKVKDGEEKIKQVACERESLEQEKWALLKRARDESERAVLLTTQIGFKDARIKEMQEEIAQLRGLGSPGSSYRTANGVETPGSDPSTASPSYANTPHTRLSPPTLLSRSAEDLFGPIPKKGPKEKKGTWGSISRVFSRNKKRKALDPDLFNSHRSSWSPKEYAGVYSDVQKLRLLEETHSSPMQHWRAATVLAWLEITMDMPQYAAYAHHNIKSGKLLLELSDSELEEGLGMSNPMHRRKLRLAIEEHRQPSLCRYPKLCLVTHQWVVEEWLSGLSLPPGFESGFRDHIVDGRILDTLTKKDLERHFGIQRKFHQLSILTAIQLLRMLGFDRQLLHGRRLRSETLDVDPLVWTNGRLVKWAESVDLGEWANNLRGTGVHGAMAVLEPTFTADTMATALHIPTSKNILRRHLTTEWNNLIQPARLSLESECKGGRGLSSGGSCASLSSQGGIGQYARRTLDRRRASWRESLRSLTSLKRSPPAERPHVLPLSPKGRRHRRTMSAQSETLTVTPV